MAKRNVSSNSTDGGVLILTIPDPAEDTVCDESIPCRSVVIQQQSGTQAYLNIGAAATEEGGWKLSATSAMPIAIDDVQKIHFFGTAGDVIQIMYRN